MTARTDDLLALVQSVYAAPGTLDAWQGFLDSLCERVKGSCASFISVRSDHQANIAVTARTDPAALNAYQQHWGALDPWGASPKLALVAAGETIVGDELVSDTDLKRTAFYADFARVHEIERCLVGVIEAGPAGVSVVSINRTARGAAFGIEESALLGALMPHLQRALQLHRRLNIADAVVGHAFEVLDHVNHAVLLLDEGARLTTANRRGRALLRQRDGLVVHQGELRAATASDTAKLRALVGQAIETSRGIGVSPGGRLILGRPSSRRPLHVIVSPVAGRQEFFDRTPVRAMVIVVDPEPRTVPDEECIRAVLGVTPAEARLAHALATGLRLEEAACRIGVSLNTARTRLKTIFDKTNVHRQVDLMLLILDSASGPFPT
jgi:DNA-binding CsgD family transcriptional regulator